MKNRKRFLKFTAPPKDALDALITRNGNLMLLTVWGGVVYDTKGNQLSKTPISERLQHGAVRNNPDDGNMAIAVCEQNEVWVSDLVGWKRSGLRLSSRGDGYFWVLAQCRRHAPQCHKTQPVKGKPQAR